MKMRVKLLPVLSVVVLATAVLLAACGGEQPATPPPLTQLPQETDVATLTLEPAATPDLQALLQERCTRCHDLARIERADKTAEEWATTVTRMVGKGAVLTPEEETLLVTYLAQTYPK